MIKKSVNISPDRLGFLIGKNKRNLREIEEILGVKFEIGKDYVTIIGEDGYNVLRAEMIVKAIDSGFTFDTAKKLLFGTYVFEAIDLEDYCEPRSFKRVLSRIIGKKGIFKLELKKYTNCDIVISEDKHMVGLIGEPEDINLAKECILKIIKGTSHGRVIRYLHHHARNPNELNIREMILRKKKDWEE